jgi:hypothetical protein
MASNGIQWVEISTHVHYLLLWPEKDSGGREYIPRGDTFAIMDNTGNGCNNRSYDNQGGIRRKG